MLFVVIAAAVIVLELGIIVSVVHSIDLSKGFKPFIRDVTRAATRPLSGPKRSFLLIQKSRVLLTGDNLFTKVNDFVSIIDTLPVHLSSVVHFSVA